MTRRDNIQVRMEIDGKQSISELGKQEMAAYEYRQEIKQIKEEQSALEKESKGLEKIKERYEQLTKRAKDMEDQGKTHLKLYEMTQNQLTQVTVEMSKAEKATKDLAVNQEKYNQTTAKLEDTKVKIAGLREQMGVAGMTMRQMRQYQSELNREMDHVTRGTDRYHELKGKLNEINGAIANQRQEVKGLDSAWAKVKTEVMKFGVLALGYLGAQEIIGKVQNLVKGSAELSDTLADVRKTTGLLDRDVKDLSKTFGEMNTRTARQELLGMAEIAGRLGIQGKKDIEGFVRAADQINVSLGDVLGDVEKVMRDVGKLTTTYDIAGTYGIEQSLLKVGSAINELGMSSTANEQYIVEFTRRMGGIAPLAKISIENVMGLAATLDSLGQTSEVSTTALSKLFISMAKNAKEYARFAKMEVKDFVKLMNEDANEAFMRMLEGVKENSNGITELAETLGDLGQDGGRVVGVLGTLANNTKILREQQNISNAAFKEGSSVTEEFALKNDNLAASLAKVQRYINRQFINSAFLGFLEKSIGGLADWVTGIDRVTMAFEKQDRYVQKLESELPKLTSRHDELKSKAELNASEQEELRSIIAKIAELVPTAVTEFDKYGNAISVSTGKVEQFTKAQIEARRVMNADAIEENEKALKKLETQITRVSMQLNRRDDDGDIFKQVSSGSGMAWKNVKLTADEIRDLSKELSSLSDKRLGLTTILEDLKGIDPAIKAGREAFLNYKKPTQGEEGNDDVTPDYVDKDAAEKARKEYDKLLEEFKKYKEGLAKLEQEAEISAMDKDSQEIARIELKYEELYAKALDFKNKKALSEEQYNETIKQIQDLQDEEIQAKIDLQSEKIKEKRQKLQEDIEAITMDDFERQKLAATKRFDDLILAAEKHGYDTIELERLRLETLANLQKDHNDKIAADHKKTAEQILQKEISIKQAMIDINMQYSSIVGSAIDLIGKKSGELTAIQKIMALAQIAIDTGAAVMKAEIVALNAAMVGGPAAPLIYKSVKLSVMASIFSAAARAKSILTDTGGSVGSGTSPSEKSSPVQGREQEPSRKSYFFGGDTSKTGMGFGDQYGEYAGYVHKHEYVIPQSVREEPIVKMQIEPILESIRMKQQGRSFFYGGPTDAPGLKESLPSSGRDNDETNALLRDISKKMDNLPKNVRAYLVYNDLEEMQNEVQELEDRYKA